MATMTASTTKKATPKKRSAPRAKPSASKLPCAIAVPLTPMELKANVMAAATPIRFDPDNKAHREAFAHFLVMRRWPVGMRFIEDWPHTSAVTTIQTKLTHWALRKEMSTLAATAEVIKNASTTDSSTNEESALQ